MTTDSSGNEHWEIPLITLLEFICFSFGKSFVKLVKWPGVWETSYKCNGIITFFCLGVLENLLIV